MEDRWRCRRQGDRPTWSYPLLIGSQILKQNCSLQHVIILDGDIDMSHSTILLAGSMGASAMSRSTTLAGDA